MSQIMPEHNTITKPLIVKSLRDAYRKEMETRVKDGSFREREEEAMTLANELIREYLQESLEATVEEHGVEYVRVDGEVYRMHLWGSAEYDSLVGKLKVRRPSFRKVGERNGETVIPLELSAGLMARVTPALAQRVAMGKADGTSRDLHRQIVSSCRIPPSRSKLERVGNALGAALDRRQAVVEAVCRRAEVLPEGTFSLCLGLDRTSAPMEEDLPEGTSIRPRKKLRLRKAPSPVTVNYRMAFVGTVAYFDEDGEMLRSYKYGATAADGPAKILHAMMQDVRRALRQDIQLRIIVVQDAAKEMWRHVVGALEDEPSAKEWEELVDHYHAMGHLWAAAVAMEADTQATFDAWRAALRNDDDAIDKIATTLNQEIARGYLPAYRIAMEDELTFITNNGARMRYASLRDAGFPIGSGVTEGACKSFFSSRCKRSGQRWRNPGLRATLTCRTLLINARLQSAIKTLRRRDYCAIVQPVGSIAA